MPYPRRKIYQLVTDANGTVVTYHAPVRVEPERRRCGKCRCILASDNTQFYCSPCLSTQAGTPPLVHEYLSYKPAR